MLQRLLDVYTLTAGDVAALYAGRAFNVRLGRWETVSGGNMSSSRLSNNVLVDAGFVAQTSAGALHDGLILHAYVSYDPSHSDLTVPWFHGMQSKGKIVIWEGVKDMGAGIVWRIHANGVIAAGDRISFSAGYRERYLYER